MGKCLRQITTLRIGIRYSVLPEALPALPTATPFAGQIPSEKFHIHVAALQLFVVVQNASTLNVLRVAGFLVVIVLSVEWFRSKRKAYK